MSSVRMCDRCSTVFSELTDGWQTYTATTIKKINGRRETVTLQLDACPACAMVPPDEAPATARANDNFFQQKLLEGRVEQLERELAEKNAPTPEPEPEPSAL